MGGFVKFYLGGNPIQHLRAEREKKKENKVCAQSQQAAKKLMIIHTREKTNDRVRESWFVGADSQDDFPPRSELTNEIPPPLSQSETPKWPSHIHSEGEIYSYANGRTFRHISCFTLRLHLSDFG